MKSEEHQVTTVTLKMFKKRGHEVRKIIYSTENAVIFCDENLRLRMRYIAHFTSLTSINLDFHK